MDYWKAFQWRVEINFLDIMVVREFIIVFAIKHHSGSPITIDNIFLVNQINHTC